MCFCAMPMQVSAFAFMLIKCDSFVYPPNCIMLLWQVPEHQFYASVFGVSGGGAFLDVRFQYLREFVFLSRFDVFFPTLVELVVLL